jgi:putative lipoprotein
MAAMQGDWVITALWWRDRSAVVASQGPVERPLTLSVEATDEGWRATGFAGCNRYFGTCSLTDDALSFGPLAATRMACMEDALNRQEMALFDALADVASCRIDHGAALLFDANGDVRAVLVRP